MGLLDRIGEKSGAALGAELGQTVPAALDQVMGKRHVVNLDGFEAKVGDVTIVITHGSITYEAEDKD